MVSLPRFRHQTRQHLCKLLLDYLRHPRDKVSLLIPLHRQLGQILHLQRTASQILSCVSPIKDPGVQQRGRSHPHPMPIPLRIALLEEKRGPKRNQHQTMPVSRRISQPLHRRPPHLYEAHGPDSLYHLQLLQLRDKRLQIGLDLHSTSELV